MHAFPTSSLCTGNNNQFSNLAAENNTDSNASSVHSGATSLPPLSSISKISMCTTTNEGPEWITSRFYTLLAATSQLGTNTPQSSTAKGTSTTPDSLKGNTNRGVSVKLENTSTNDIQEALQNLQFKCTCVCKQQEQEEEEEQ